MRNQNIEQQMWQNPGQMKENANNTDQKHQVANRQSGYRHQEGQQYAPNAYEVHSQGNPGQNDRNLKVYQPSAGGSSKRSYGINSQGAQSCAVQSVNDG